LLALLLAVPIAAAAQQTSRLVPVNVDYLAGQTLYISAGLAQGLFAEDTVTAFSRSSSVALGRLVIVSSTRARAVAAYVGSGFAVTRGSALLLEIPETALARLRTAQADDSTNRPRAGPPLERDRAIPPPSSPRSPSFSVHGRMSLDVDASQSTSQWGTNPGEEDRYRFHNQSGQLRFTVNGLPGSARLVSNVRATNYGTLSGTPGKLALSIYQASLEKDFTSLPLRLQFGRFYNPYESHSGYWDGGLVRVGGENVGGGAAIGYEPENGNETFSAVRPKYSAFVDVHQRRGQLRYDGDFSWHRDQPQFSSTRREFLGMTQHFSWRGAFLTQRVQLGHVPTGAWSLWQAQITGSIPLIRASRLHARYAAERNDLFDPGVTGARRERRAIGLSTQGALGYANVEAGTTASGLGTNGRSVMATVGLLRAPLGLTAGLTGSYWTEGEVESIAWSPTLERSFRSVRTRAAFQLNRTDYATALYLQRGGEVSFVVPVRAGLEVYIALRSDWAGNTTSQRVLTSIWKTF
jgi:hypothetical protein